jgi:hypothetical protein
VRNYDWQEGVVNKENDLSFSLKDKKVYYSSPESRMQFNMAALAMLHMHMETPNHDSPPHITFKWRDRKKFLDNQKCADSLELRIKQGWTFQSSRTLAWTKLPILAEEYNVPLPLTYSYNKARNHINNFFLVVVSLKCSSVIAISPPFKYHQEEWRAESFDDSGFKRPRNLKKRMKMDIQQLANIDPNSQINPNEYRTVRVSDWDFLPERKECADSLSMLVKSFQTNDRSVVIGYTSVNWLAMKRFHPFNADLDSDLNFIIPTKMLLDAQSSNRPFQISIVSLNEICRKIYGESKLFYLASPIN